MAQEKRRSLVSRVMDELVTGIVEGDYRGVLPPQDILAQEFEVSRTVMREALSMLLARSMLDVKSKVGTRLRPMRDWRMIDEDVVSWRFRAKPDVHFMRDVIEFRMLIEPRAAAQAAVRASMAELGEIRQAFEVFKDFKPSEPEYEAADELLHTRIVYASGNQFFQQMATIIQGALRLVNPLLHRKPEVHEIVVAAHERLVVALERRNPREAEAAALALDRGAADLIAQEFAVDWPAREPER